MARVEMNLYLLPLVFLVLQLYHPATQHPTTDFSTGKNRPKCSDCKEQLSKRIRHMQHLQRMKQRIMSAIRNNGNQVPVGYTGGDGTRDLGDGRPRGPGVVPASSKPSTPSDVNSTASQGSKGNVIPATTRRRQDQEATARQIHTNTSATTSSTPSSDDQRRSSSVARWQRLQGRPRKGSDDQRRPSSVARWQRLQARPRKGSQPADVASSVLEREGPNIVTISRVVSSRKRKHVLQFKLKPSSGGEDMEVVKAHLWLLLTRHQSQSEGNNKVKNIRDDTVKQIHQRGKMSDKDNSKVTLRKRSRRTKARKRTRQTKARKRTRQTKARKITRQTKARKRTRQTRAKHVRKRHEETERRKRSSSSVNLNSKNTSDQHAERKHHKVNHQELTNTDTDDVNDDENNDDDDERSQAALRVLLLSENGTRTLMTYFRTNVRETHWRKVRLPVSIIQHQLQSAQTTLTFLIRCRRCGDDINVILPKQRRSKRRRKERRRRRRRRRRKNGRKKKREEKKAPRMRTRRHGLRDKHGPRNNRKHRRKLFFPLPFLVINTRIRTHRKRVM